MKNICVFIITAIVLVACENSEDCGCVPPPEKTFKSYIQTFIECGKIRDHKLQVVSNIGLKVDTVKKTLNINANVDFSTPYSIENDIWLEIVAQSSHVIDRDSSLYYAVPQIGRTDFLFSNGDNPNDPFYLERQRMYDKYIDIVGDTLFNKKLESPPKSNAIITPVKDIVITCDKDFTSEFPAGSNLNSLFTVYFDNPYATVKNNYRTVEGSYRYEWVLSDFPVSIFEAPLSEINFSNYPFISNKWNCRLNVAPENTGSYIFHPFF
jgi:hypothetical protein